jgi:hypothetical protein
MSKEAMKLALEALQECRRDPRLKYEHPIYDKAIKALEEALAKQEQGEPVGCVGKDGYTMLYYENELQKLPPFTELYTTPQQRTWVGLTDDEMYQVMQDRTWMHTEGLCRAIEAKLKEKNT